MVFFFFFIQVNRTGVYCALLSVSGLFTTIFTETLTSLNQLHIPMWNPLDMKTKQHVRPGPLNLKCQWLEWENTKECLQHEPKRQQQQKNLFVFFFHFLWVRKEWKEIKLNGFAAQSEFYTTTTRGNWFQFRRIDSNNNNNKMNRWNRIRSIITHIFFFFSFSCIAVFIR